jgi:hypothetical protein
MSRGNRNGRLIEQFVAVGPAAARPQIDVAEKDGATTALRGRPRCRQSGPNILVGWGPLAKRASSTSHRQVSSIREITLTGCTSSEGQGEA